jgi:type VI secretion system Hcp family effector
MIQRRDLRSRRTPMRAFGRRGVWVGSFGALLVMAAAPLMAGTKISLQIDGIAGAERVNKVVHEMGPRPAAANGRHRNNPIVVTKDIDAASPQLARMNSKVLPKVVLTFERTQGPAGAQEKTAQKLELRNAVITGIRRLDKNLEEISFEYETIQVTYEKGGTTTADDWNVPNS